MTALEQYVPGSVELVAQASDPTGGRLVAWAGAGRAAWQIAEAIADTDFIPRHFKGKPGDIMAALMLSDELGLPPVSGLRSIYVISGTPALYARTMVALAMQHGHEVWTEASTDAAVTVCGQRHGSKHVERSTWDAARARKAGYTSNKKYESDPQAMLYAKAAAEVARKIAPDVLNGVPYSVEDLELENQPTTPVARASSRVARAPRPQAPEPEFDEPAEPVQATAERVSPSPEPDAKTQALAKLHEKLEPITAAQLKKLHASLGDNGLSDRDAGLAFISQTIGRDVDTSKALTKAEASQVIEALNPEPPLPEPEFDEARDV